MKFDFIFIVLTYINSNDLSDLLISISNINNSYKVIVVDAFHDKVSSEKIKSLADSNQAVYLQIPNKGYSYGNNYGIAFALKNYQFKFLVVSNPDIIIRELDIEKLHGLEECVIGPEIYNANNKNQNPMFIYESRIFQKLVYIGLKNNIKTAYYSGIALNKLFKLIFFLLYGNKKLSVYQLHGSFIIFGFNIVKRLNPIFDEKMFLFAEESYLAFRLHEEGIKSIYLPEIQVFHKEDGSMRFRDDINEHMYTSNIYVFEKYYKFGEKDED